jgi:hypothetical protein
MWLALADADMYPVGQAAGKSGQHTVSPAPSTATPAAEQRLDRPAPYRHTRSRFVPRLDVLPWPFSEFQALTGGRQMTSHGRVRDGLVVAKPAVAGLTGVPGDG